MIRERKWNCVVCGQETTTSECVFFDSDLEIKTFFPELDNNCCRHKEKNSWWPPTVNQIARERYAITDMAVYAIEKAKELGFDKTDELKTYLEDIIQEWVEHLLEDRE